ncbi:MAG: hypothetical protein QX199_13415 [Methylococcaceae bacterium]
MKRNKPISDLGQEKTIELKHRAAFHEAGHAAGIYLNTKARHLSPAFFKIIFKEIHCVTEAGDTFRQTNPDNCIAQVQGGRLIECLPHSIDSLVHELTERNDAMEQLVKDYMIAFEADIINLLIGPLAEAKHIADIDDELFNHQLVNLKALTNYGGISNLALVNEYLQCFSVDKQNDKKLAELFTEAFDFVNNDANWAAITQLAGYILGSSCKNIISCEEIILMLDQSLANFKDRRTMARHHHNTWSKVTDQPIKISYGKNIRNAKCPSQAELDSMSHSEKDALILILFDLL